MAVAEQKIVVHRPQSRDTVPTDSDREFWVQQRHGLLVQLAAIERRLGIVNQRCRFCKTVREDPERR